MTADGMPLRFQHRRIGGPSGVRDSAMRNIKAEVVRVGNNGTREGFKFAVSMFVAYPELKHV